MKPKLTAAPGSAWLERLSAQKAAIRRAVGYPVVSVLWILLSSQLVRAIAPNQEVQTVLEDLKGWFYVGLSALTLYYFTRRTLNRVQQLDNAMLHHVLNHRAEIEHYHMLLNASSDQ